MAGTAQANTLIATRTSSVQRLLEIICQRVRLGFFIEIISFCEMR
jgi:hypothetical protein